MKAIISLTSQGNELALKIANFWSDVHCYTLVKWKDDRFLAIDGKLKDFCEILFQHYDSLVFIMATGIVVRSIAPWLNDKTSDPAVLVMDEKGRNVISLLSGHLGGANQLCEDIALRLVANPVITTASDVNELPSVDMMAQSKALVISDMNQAKVITAMMVNGSKVVMHDEDAYFETGVMPEREEPVEGEIIVSHKAHVKRDVPFVQLIPKDIYLGVGCKKDTDSKVLEDFVNENLQSLELDRRSVNCVASIDIKREEVAIQNLANSLTCPLKFYGVEELKEYDHLFEGSEFVKNTVGVASVSSTAAYKCGGTVGKFLLVKQVKDGMTLSVFKRIDS